MAISTPAALEFTARRQPAVLVAPAAPTPRELKLLSDIDDQAALRCHLPVIRFYRRNASMDGRDPAPVIRDAVAGALAHYYPLAGRLRELEGRKLAVDCTGEGVLFVEADADVRLEHFGDAVHPPLPCLDELLFDVPGSSAIVNSPLLLFQVTRLACEGFVGIDSGRRLIQRAHSARRHPPAAGQQLAATTQAPSPKSSCRARPPDIMPSATPSRTLVARPPAPRGSPLAAPLRARSTPNGLALVTGECARSEPARSVCDATAEPSLAGLVSRLTNVCAYEVSQSIHLR